MNNRTLMHKSLVTLALLMAGLLACHAQDGTLSSVPDTTVRVRYMRIPKAGDETVFEENLRRGTLFVNEEVTTHVIMPEAIRLTDISTDRVVGNQCADNMLRIKPTHRQYDGEMLGTVTLVGERHLAQFNVIYTQSPKKAHSTYTVTQEDMRNYTNPEVRMPQAEMARYAWAIFGSGRKFNGIHVSANGIRAVVNNIYTVNEYFFIDYSLYNSTRIQYDIDEVRVKLTDKKEARATNSQTLELTPVYSLNHAASFRKGYRNVLVIDRLTFPEEKVLQIEISEHQISGRTVTIPIEYADILHADSFDASLLRTLSAPHPYNR